MTIEEKAERLLLAGAITIDTQRALVKGDHGDYTVTQLAGRWWCTCKARKRCSHIEAVSRVTGERVTG